MVVDEINKAGGVKGHKLELIAYDTGGDATKAVQLATKLIKNDKVVAIIGPSTTGESMAVISGGGKGACASDLMRGRQQDYRSG